MFRAAWKIQVLVALFSVSAWATVCDVSTAKPYVNVLEKGLASNPVWKSVPNEQIRFLISDKPTHQVFIVGSPKSELIASGLKIDECTNLPGVFRFSDLKLPSLQDNAFAPCDQSPEPENCLGSSELKAWHDKTNRNAVIFATPLASDLTKAAQFTGATRTQELAWIDFHETFHNTHQLRFKSFYDVKDHFLSIDPMKAESQEACEKDSAWQAALKSEFSDWKSLLGPLDTMTKDQITSRVKTILERRCNKGTPSSCWDLSGERTEGLANYFGIETLIAANQMTPQERNRIVSSYFQADLKTGKITAHGSAYGTGHAMALVLDRLQPDKQWQDLVEQGYSPVDILARIVEPQDPFCHPTDPNQILQNSGLTPTTNSKCP